MPVQASLSDFSLFQETLFFKRQLSRDYAVKCLVVDVFLCPDKFLETLMTIAATVLGWGRYLSSDLNYTNLHEISMILTETRICHETELALHSLHFKWYDENVLKKSIMPAMLDSEAC